MFIAVILLSVLSLVFSAPVAPPDIYTRHVEPLVLFGRQVPVNVARYRTMQDIIWSCIATMLACTWFAIHPNLPGVRESGWRRFKRKVVTMIYALIAPEFMAAWALRQWIAAQWIAREFNKEKEEEIPWYLVVPSAVGECCMCIWNVVDEWFRDPPQNPSKAWTLTHGFFVQMGGFVLYANETPLRVLTFDDLKKLIEEGKVDTPNILEEEINDKNKGEVIGKLLVIIQTTWFLFQCIARWTVSLPVTELEVITLAFASLNIITYGLWWKKPQGVLVPVRVQLKGDADRAQGAGNVEKESFITRKVREGMSDGWCGGLFSVPYRLAQAMLRPLEKMWYRNTSKVVPLSLRIPMFYADKTDDKENFPFALISVLFGLLHLIPWSSSFPSAAERWLWRLSTLVIIAEPIVFYVAYRLNEHLDSGVAVLLLLLSLVPAPLYIFARLTLLVLAFTTLRQLPRGAYIAIEWTTFVPHI